MLFDKYGGEQTEREGSDGQLQGQLETRSLGGGLCVRPS